MPLPLADLDTLRYDDLVEQGRAMIPRYAPEWTDHNAHDPGITLIELFASCVEQVSYRANRIPDRITRKFLALAGCLPRPAVPARVPLTFTMTTATGWQRIPAGTIVTSNSPGFSVPFSTLTAVDVLPLSIQSVHVFDGQSYIDQTTLWGHRQPFAALGLNPSISTSAKDKNPSFILGLSAVPSQGSLSLWLRFDGSGHDAAERQRLRHRGKYNPTHHSASTCWEFYNGILWTPLRGVEDATRALTLDGTVRLDFPVGIGLTQPPSGLKARGLYLRCRLASGQLDAAPILLDVDANTVEAEQALEPLTQIDVAPGLDLSRLPTGQVTRHGLVLDDAGRLKALAASTRAPAPLLAYQTPARPVVGLLCVGRGDGTPNQTRVLSGGALANKVGLWTLSPSGWMRWRQRPDLDASKRADAHFMIDAQTGDVIFGDGECGRVLRPDETVYATYRSTAGSAGNLPAGTPWCLTGAGEVLNRLLLGSDPAKIGLSIANHSPASGGVDPEDLDGAAGRTVNALWAHERLVENALPGGTLDGLPSDTVRTLEPPSQATTLADYERLALDVPGTRVNRARAWVSKGKVIVLIVPELPVGQPSPSVGLVQAVQRYLDERRTVGTQLQVRGPDYTTMEIIAAIAAKATADSDRVRGEVGARLSQFLDPLCGGADGRGWPFGRSVYRAEILQYIQDVPGVDFVASLQLNLNGVDQGNRVDLTNDPETAVTYLVALGNIQVLTK